MSRTLLTHQYDAVVTYMSNFVIYLQHREYQLLSKIQEYIIIPQGIWHRFYLNIPIRRVN